MHLPAVLTFFLISQPLMAGSSSSDDEALEYSSPKRSKQTATRYNESEATEEEPSTQRSKPLHEISYLDYVAHELRNQATGFGALECIELGDLDPNDRESVEIAILANKSLKNLLNSLLDTSQIETGRLILNHVQFSPLSVAQEVVRELTFLARVHKLSLTAEVAPEIPDIVVGDPTRFREILFNLLQNSIKYTQTGSVLLTLNAEEKCDHYKILGGVKDTGPGIPPEVQKTLFEPHSQERAPSLTGVNGLGLYITQELCTAMRGEIAVKSEVGTGSTFRFSVCLDKPS